ncbi:hypothetical protein PLESTB_001659200 [Pleodorina starrii]|uniref:Uncharacterized protein n=1 Tax=Pleodorina starrii TaxID=330485 RepID=A0A9W6BZF5_9CHLO|nr:hypothetical protein PLESTM_000971700 [Pleodorina starrii]GLC60695.1 hypothetical protein PLESTB_001659200 [Pleodorina starrii]GLC65912.1 hypothetical protein PLESTF_000357400 [Pleodorina starrii]
MWRRQWPGLRLLPPGRNTLAAIGGLCRPLYMQEALLEAARTDSVDVSSQLLSSAYQRNGCREVRLRIFSIRSESPDDRLTTSVLECAPGKRPDAVALGLLSNTQVYTMDGSRMDCLMLAHEASRHMLAQNPAFEDWGCKDMSGFQMRLADATDFIKDSLYERARDAGSASAAAAASLHQLPMSDTVEQLPNIDAALLADFGVPLLEVLDDIRASALAPAPGDGLTDRQVNDALAARTLPVEALGVMAAFTESTPAVVMTLETLSGGFSAVRVGVFTAGEALVQGQPLCSPSLVAWSGGHANVAVPLPDGDLTIFIDDPAHLMPEVQKSSHRQLGMAFRMEHLPAHMRAMLRAGAPPKKSLLAQTLHTRPVVRLQ